MSRIAPTRIRKLSKREFTGWRADSDSFSFDYPPRHPSYWITRAIAMAFMLSLMLLPLLMTWRLLHG